MSQFNDSEVLLIEDEGALKQILQIVSEADYIALDTEFVRNNTYFPKCCLIQFATRECAGIIDTLALNPSPFIIAIQDKTKIFHDAKQDVECLSKYGTIDLKTIFDTQTAELFLDYYEGRPSYKSVVQKYFGKKLDKALTTADWEARPLDEDMLQYAIKDVTFLHDIYPLQIQALTELGRLDTCLELIHREITEYSDHKASDEPTTVREAILLWRTRKAMALNQPANWIMHINALSELVKRMPKTISEFYASRSNAVMKIREHDANEIIRIINAFHDQEVQPAIEHKPAVVSLLKLVLTEMSMSARISPSVIASVHELQRFAEEGELPNITPVQSSIFWGDAQKLLLGELGVRIMDGKLSLIRK